MKKTPLLIIAGPTASGKSALAVELALRFGGEVISADSMQVYRGMDIGTAKIRPDETKGVPHHLIDVVAPDEEWNVMEFCRKAAPLIEEIASRGRLPILCGGTGFYIHALAYGAEFEEEEPSGVRQELEALPTDELARRLAELDPESAASIHPNNRKRVIRALEYLSLTGETISAHNARLREKEAPYELLYLVLSPERAKLYERIERRVDRMLEEGLVEEVRGLLARGCGRSLVSMQGLGYKEIAAFLEGECGEAEAVEAVKLGTRHFAKRQLTWFRREPDAVFLDAGENFEELLADAAALCRARLDID